MKPEVFLHPMAKWSYIREFENGKNSGGFIKYVRFLAYLVDCIGYRLHKFHEFEYGPF